MRMTDDELYAAVLPLLYELVVRGMLYGAIRQNEKGEWVLSAILDARTGGGIIEFRLEDDAASIAKATFL